MFDRRKTPPTGPLPGTGATTLTDRILWLCPAIGLIAGAVVLWLFGLSLWTAVGIMFLVACPLVVVWVLAIARRQNTEAKTKR